MGWKGISGTGVYAGQLTDLEGAEEFEMGLGHQNSHRSECEGV